MGIIGWAQRFVCRHTRNFYQRSESFSVWVNMFSTFSLEVTFYQSIAILHQHRCKSHFQQIIFLLQLKKRIMNGLFLEVHFSSEPLLRIIKVTIFVFHYLQATKSNAAIIFTIHWYNRIWIPLFEVNNSISRYLMVLHSFGFWEPIIIKSRPYPKLPS